jgi:hypothetical protein
VTAGAVSRRRFGDDPHRVHVSSRAQLSSVWGITPQATCPVHVPHNNYAWASGRCGNGRWWRLEANCLRADGKHFHLVFGNWSHPVGTSIIRCPKGERFFDGKPDIQVW